MIRETASREELLEIIAVQEAMIAQLVASLAAQERISAEQQERLAALSAQVKALSDRLATDSHNSSKPPSTDEPGAKPHPQSQRVRQGRKPGGQPGHAGHTLRLVEKPDVVEVHSPGACGACGQSLASVPASAWERRQVVDLPPVRVQIVEHQVATKTCPGCGTRTGGAFPAGVTAPVQYGPGVSAIAVYLNQAQLLPLARTCEVLAELFGCPVAEGTVERAVGQCFTQLAAVEAAIKAGIIQAGVVHFDETGLRLGGGLAWLHVASTARLTYYAAHRQRGHGAVDDMDILPGFTGRALHDGWATYWRYLQCAHGLCNAHHLRELTFVAERLGQGWAQELADLLREIKRAVDTARAQGEDALAAERQQAFFARYDALLAAGLLANPPPPPTGQRGRPKRGKAGSLVDRLQLRRAATLAFMEDFTVPFDNNQAERDIRMTKVRQKISGCFRTTIGADHFCRIRGYLSTLRKQGLPLLSALRLTFAGIPPFPATT